MDHRDRGDVHGVPGVALERPDAPLAQDHVRVAARQHVLRRQQPFLDGGRDAALEEDRGGAAPQLPQQGVVLHVAGADLQDVRVPGHEVDLADVHDLRDHLEALGVGGVAHEPQPLLAQPLEAVGRAARLERAAPQHLGARLLDGGGGGGDLLLGLHRARPGHDDHLVAADAEAAERHRGVLRPEGPARQLVGLGDAHHLVHAVHHLDEAGIEPPVAPHRAQHAAQLPGRPVHVELVLHQVRDDLLNLILARALFHHDNHGPALPRPSVSADPPDSPG